MVLKPEHFISEEILEAKASDLLAGYGSRYGHVERLPIPLEHLLEYHLELAIDCDVIAEAGADVPAALDYWNRTILINDRARPLFEQYPGLETFSLAHEIGHWVLHVDKAALDQPSLPGMDPRPPLLCRHRDQSPREIQAEKFAAYLLMPRDLVFTTIHGRNLTSWPVLYEVARGVGVSITALTVRLAHLGVVYVGEDRSISRAPRGQTSILP